MKKHILAMSAIIACMSVSTAGISFAESIDLSVNGKSVAANESYVDDGTLMVPFRAVADALGAETSWNDKNKTIEVSLNGENVNFTVGKAEIETFASEFYLDKAVVIKNDRAYVPATFFNYGFGSDVNWDEQSGKCSITSYNLDEKTGLKTVYNTISNSVKADDGTKVLAYEIRYAHIDSETESAKTINKTLKSEAEKTAADFKNDYTESQTELLKVCKKDSEMNFRPATLTSDVQIYNSGTYFSVLNTYCYDLGGAHPTSARASHVFRLNDGKEATATECTGLKDSDAVKEAVLKGWSNKITNNKDYYFEDAAKTLEENYNDVGFYLDEKGIVFYMPLYEIAPYVAGFPEYEYLK